jgi:uncharacterized damage-inducible protein DinB
MRLKETTTSRWREQQRWVSTEDGKTSTVRLDVHGHGRAGFAMSTDIIDQMLEAWRTNNRINLFLIDRISDEGLRCSLSTRGGRDVARQFAHMHDVRVWALQTRAKELSAGLKVFASKHSPDRNVLKSALNASCDAVGLFLTDLIGEKPKRRGSRKGWISHLSYFIAHESHHRGSILLTLKQSSHNLDQETRYAIWNWDKM